MSFVLRETIPGVYGVMAPNFVGFVEKTPARYSTSPLPEWHFILPDGGTSYGTEFRTKTEAAEGLISYLTNLKDSS